MNYLIENATSYLKNKILINITDRKNMNLQTCPIRKYIYFVNLAFIFTVEVEEIKELNDILGKTILNQHEVYLY